MKNAHFSEELQEIVREPFVFISYCHKNGITFQKVQELASYLKGNNIPIVYDEGGLDAGEELIQFENLILDDNCKFVLIICDDEYIQKAQQNEGGVWQEFFLISNNYPKNVRKYIPLKRAERVLPIFEGKVYIDFSDANENAFIEILKLLDSVRLKGKKKAIKNKQQIRDLYNKADDAYTKKNYKTAKTIIKEAIDACPKKNKMLLLRCINLELCINIHMKVKKDAIDVADRLAAMITSRTDPYVCIKYYTNCALAYRLSEDKKEEYERYALQAYQLALKYGDEDLDYYACMYATALYETEQFSTAYKVIKQAYRVFIERHKNNIEYTLEEQDLLIKIKGNMVAIAVSCSENLHLSRKQKHVYLEEARENILELLCENNFEYDDVTQVEIYEIAEDVFGA